MAAAFDESKYLPLYCYRRHKHPEKDLDEATFTAILEKIPKEVYKPSWTSPLLQFLKTVFFTAASITVFAKLPWVFIPLGWIFGAIALVNWFNIGHDCTHDTWTPSAFINDIMGEIAFLPLLHPFQSFRYKHNFNEKLLKRTDLRAQAKVVGSHPVSLLNTLGFWGFFEEHYSVATFPKKLSSIVSRSIIFSLICVALCFGIMVYYGGLIGPVIYWLVPLLLYKDILYLPWLEFQRRGVDIHFPSRIAQSIPSYNLRTASKSIVSILNRASEDATLARLQADAVKQKEGAKAEGYDHKYGEEVLEEAETTGKKQKSWYKKLNWINVIILLGTPIAGVYGLLTTELHWKTVLFAVIYYYYTGLGITAGYHRYWAHRAYKAVRPVEILLMLAGSGALEGSLKWWCGGHRVHHRYTDTPKDPYNIRGGFWYAHMGWMLMKPDKKYQVRADIRDLKADPMINFQHKHYGWIGPFMAFVLPSLIAGFGWGDFRGGYFYAGVLRLIFVHHSTFCVNSVAHFFGGFTYDDERSPRDNLFTAFLTLGEGYHNFHHEFPNDYRNGIRFYDYDPTKWLIAGLSLLGLTYELKEFPANEVTKGQLHMKQKKLDQEKAKIMYPGPIQSLPEWNWTEIKQKIQRGAQLVVVEGLVHDVSNFVKSHPGGEVLLRSAIGTDATARFNGKQTRGETYKHSTAARHLLTTFRVARLAPPVESDVKDK